jgi:hypothetical protein
MLPPNVSSGTPDEVDRKPKTGEWSYVKVPKR